MESSVYAERAQVCLDYLMGRIEASSELHPHRQHILELVTLQLAGPTSWSPTDRKKLRELLSLESDEVNGVVADVIQTLRIQAKGLAENDGQPENQHWWQLVASFLILVTHRKIQEIERQLSLRIVASVGICAVLGMGYLLFRLAKVLHGHPPEA